MITPCSTSTTGITGAGASGAKMVASRDGKGPAGGMCGRMLAVGDPRMEFSDSDDSDFELPELIELSFDFREKRRPTVAPMVRKEPTAPRIVRFIFPRDFFAVSSLLRFLIASAENGVP